MKLISEDILRVLLKTYAAFLPQGFVGKVVLTINYDKDGPKVVTCSYEEGYKLRD